MPQGLSQMTQTFFGGYKDELRKQGVPKKLDGTCCSFLAVEEATQQMLRYKSVRYFIALTCYGCCCFGFYPSGGSVALKLATVH